MRIEIISVENRTNAAEVIGERLIRRQLIQVSHESEGTMFASLTFSSGTPQFAALALFIQAGILTSLPVERLQ